MLLDKKLMTTHGAEDGADVLRVATEERLFLPLVVVISAHLDGDAVRTFLDLNVRALMSKPVRSSALPEILAGICDGMAPLEVPGTSNDEVLEAQLIESDDAKMLVYGNASGASLDASAYMRVISNPELRLSGGSKQRLPIGRDVLLVPDSDAAMVRSDRSGIEVFVSYSHLDGRLREELDKYLFILKRNEVIRVWHDGEISPGTPFSEQITQHLESATLILLLVTKNFIASDYCYCKEMKVALERHNSGHARVIPIILRPADWRYTPFGKLAALPREGKPPALWRNRDSAFLDIVEGIRRVVKELGEQSSDA
jgi:hypothetical protein